MAGYSVRETKIDIPQDEIDHFRQMLTITRFPESPIVPGADEDRSTYGTKLSDFKEAKERLLSFDWRKFEAEMNRKADCFPPYILGSTDSTIYFW